MTGNSKVMLGTSGNRLAVQMLSDIAQGRGAHVALNTVRVAYHFLSSFLYSKPYWKDYHVSERFCIKYATLTYWYLLSLAYAGTRSQEKMDTGLKLIYVHYLLSLIPEHGSRALSEDFIHCINDDLLDV